MRRWSPLWPSASPAVLGSADGVEEQLCSFGTFGLIDVIERWDASAGFQFATYATRRIQGAIIDELRHEDFLPKRLRARVQVFHATQVKTSQSRLRRTPTHCGNRHRTGARCERRRSHCATRQPFTSPHLAPLTEGSEASEGRILAAATTDLSPSEGAERAVMNDSVKAALRRLTERPANGARPVLPRRPGTRAEIADILGVGRPRVTRSWSSREPRTISALSSASDQSSDIDDLLPDPVRAGNTAGRAPGGQCRPAA